MAGKRARGEAQKQQRLDEILKAANTLLNQYAYRDITMAMIAGEVGFSRANLVHYVETREEIFLLLFLEDMYAICDELCQRYAGGGPVEIEDFAEHFAAACTQHPNFCRVGALLYSIIEANLSAERLAGYKRQMLQRMGEVAGVLCGCFSFLVEESAVWFVHTLLDITVGLYPRCHPGPVQREAMQRIGYEGSPGFEAEIRRYVVVQLQGLRALHKKKSSSKVK